MSQITFTQYVNGGTNDGAEVELQVGWDKPLQRFYAVAERADNGDLLYCNLDDRSVPRDPDEQLAHFAIKLNGVGLSLPSRAVRIAKEHRQRDAVNEAVHL